MKNPRIVKIGELLAEKSTRGKALIAHSETGTFTADHQTEWDQLKKDVTELKAELANLIARDTEAEEFLALDRQYNQPGNPSAARTVTDELAAQQAQNGPTQRSNIVTLGQRVTAPERLQEYRDRGKATVDIGSFYHLSADDWTRIRGGSRAMEQLALVYTGTFPTGAVEPQRIPGILQQSFLRPTVRDAFSNTPTTSNLITFVRELLLSHTNAADWIDEPSASADSSGLKPESTLVFDDGEAPVRECATHIPMSENIMDDLPGLQSLVENRLLDFLSQVEDDGLLNGDGITPNLLGLRNHSGIQVADAAYFADVDNAVQDQNESNEDFNRILAAISLVRYPGLGTASYIFMSQRALNYFLTVTDANRNYLGGGPFVTGSIPRIWGVPVIVTTALDTDDNIAIVGDGRTAEVRDRMQGTIDIGWIDKQFVRDMKTIRAKERLAFPVYREAAHVEVELAFN